MTRYPVLEAEVRRLGGIEAFAARAGVDPAEIAALVTGRVPHVAERSYAERVANAVGIPDLFRLDDAIEAHLAAIEAAGGSRQVTDPSIIRAFNRA